MYTIAAVSLTVLFFVTTVVLPFKCSKFCENLGFKLLKFRSHKSSQVPIQLRIRNSGPYRFLIRAWGIVAIAFFAAVSYWLGAWEGNHPNTLSKIGQSAAVGYTLSSLLVMTLLSYNSLLPRLFGMHQLERCGIKQLWAVDLLTPQQKLRSSLRREAQATKKIFCLDITGKKILGKGPSEQGGLLFDIVKANPTTPVCLLLFKPDATNKDPERKISSVFSTLLSEMEISRENYLQQVRETLEAVAFINQNRSKENEIVVRYYHEKPTFQVILFDDKAFAFPWQPREEKDLIPLLELEQSPEGSAFYESYRRHFARIWGSPIQESQVKIVPTQKQEEEVERPWKASKKTESSRNIQLTKMSA